VIPVANDEPPNGLKIMRKKDPVIDLGEDLEVLSHSLVIQRLKLLLEKLNNGVTAEEVTPDVLKRHIQYALDIIQDGANVDRFDLTPLLLLILR